ncbi:helix-turn-helix domain-containing protein [Anaerocolumna xylanovorans]|uniref:Helix-turn-helix domain-containing protein n=1 Tax=Anaerocolumna xylanovorans DSM 12503 TaxID=1121345 RepID=A0A1M7YBZ8_9FIRM|nr:helix-turn-helix transcriptional regulator [Anaerocolumna xylanovorans]SHO50164.1 Helix-turn-helix domain-containing protein [Anaerocolumna xylanovorans DSM 12503]
MDIGDRIKKIRKELDLTQAEFGARIGSVQNTVTGYESGRRNPSAPVIALICEKFNVCEEWLRNGNGEMFKPAPSDVLDQLAYEYNLSNASYVAIEKFVSLKPEKRNELIEFFLEVSKAILESEADPNAPAFTEGCVPTFSQDSLIQAFRDSVPKTPEELEKKFPPVKSGREDAG